VNLIIRPARRRDLPELLKIEHESFAHEPWDSESFFSYKCIVADISGTVAGFLVSRQIFAGGCGSPPEREILNVAVASAFRRQGVATALLRHHLAKGVIHFLEVRESNAAALALYRKIGFRQVGRREDYYRNPVEAAIVMQMKEC
jgi:ribosomal-protein-alanine acetyltransferase